MFNQFWDISWYTSSRLAWFVGCFCVVSWQRQAWLHYSFLGTQATGKANVEDKDSKRINADFHHIEFNQTWQTWVHIWSQHVPTIYILHADIFKYIRYSYAFAVEFWFYDLICNDDSTVMHVSICILSLHIGTCVLWFMCLFVCLFSPCICQIWRSLHWFPSGMWWNQMISISSFWPPPINLKSDLYPFQSIVGGTASQIADFSLFSTMEVPPVPPLNFEQKGHVPENIAFMACFLSPSKLVLVIDIWTCFIADVLVKNMGS